MTAEPRIDPAQQAYAAFLRELPELWETHPNQFVAYRGGTRFGLGKEKHVLHRQCQEAGLAWGEYIIFGIVPQDDEIVFGPLLEP
ncbi:MAG: hypothetical protein K2W96_09750 [Gemmataceae bacterium]|nr:hypothetical protein [Gemmataceae bacterium]